MDEETSEPKVMPGLVEGRMVHYVMGGESRHPGEHRPAVIVKVWDHGVGTSNLCVFVDGSNDLAELPDMTMWATSIHYSEGKEPHTWHWIEQT